MDPDRFGWLELEDLGSACYICNASGIDELFEVETPHGLRVLCMDCNVDWPKEEATTYEVAEGQPRVHRGIYDLP